MQPTIPAPPAAQATPRRTWTARVFSLPTVLGLLLLSLLFVFTGSGSGASNLDDPDIWWHLRNASQLLHSGHFIRADSWTFTVAGKPWINFEWLADLPYYFAYQHWGDQGLYVGMMLLMSTIVAGVYWLGCLRSQDCKASFAACLVGLHFVTVSLAPRTLLFGWLFLVLELGILWSLQSGRDYTAWLPPLFLLWINTHGSWLIGFAVMVVFFACGFVQGEWGNLHAARWTHRQQGKFLLVTITSFALLFVNPYGWRLVAYPLDVALHQQQTLQHVSEWMSLDFHTARGKTALATLLLFGVLQLVHARKWSLQDLALVFIALYGGLTYVRFLFLMGIVIMPLLAMELRGVLAKPYEAEKDRRWINAVAAAVVLAMIAGFWPSRSQLHAGITRVNPEKALPTIQSLAGTGNLFNAIEWGAYLEWHAPQVKEFVDTRIDIFVHQGTLSDYLQATNIQDPYAILDKYQIRYVLVGKQFPLAWLLEHNPAWKITYQDDLAVLLERVH
ncbi:MAG TPA: hypothetical protein VIY53_15295 [Acidobacteriaceae bacterium]